MKLKDLKKYLSENPVPVQKFITQRKRTLIVIGDSKGGRLANVVEDIYPENSIIWKCKGGRNSFQCAEYAIQNVEHFVETFGNIVIAIWTGTCDLTEFQSRSKRYNSGSFGQFSHKARKYINLSDISVEDIIVQYQRIVSACKKYGDRIKLVFLECPQYSIYIWNKIQGDPDFENYKENTEVLNEKVKALNKSIRLINNTCGIVAPKFGIDLQTSRKSNQSYTSTKVSYSLLTDGIHPSVILSQYWLRRIVLCICPECFS